MRPTYRMAITGGLALAAASVVEAQEEAETHSSGWSSCSARIAQVRRGVSRRSSRSVHAVRRQSRTLTASLPAARPPRTGMCCHQATLSRPATAVRAPGTRSAASRAPMVKVARSRRALRSWDALQLQMTLACSHALHRQLMSHSRRIATTSCSRDATVFSCATAHPQKAQGKRDDHSR